MREVQLAKALFPIVVTPAGRLIVDMEVQPEKAYCSIVSSSFEKAIEERAVQLWNAECPIVVSLSGRNTWQRAVQSAKVYASIVRSL